MLKFRKETEFKKTEIDEVPEEWEVENGDILEIKCEKTLPKKKCKKYFV